MPAERLPMRKVREVLRQKYALGASEREIAHSTGLGRTAVGEYMRRAAVIGITWPIPSELDDAELERRLFAPPSRREPARPLPDWAHVHAELKRRGVTLAAAVAGVSRRARRRLRLQPVLRAATATGGSASRRRCARRMWRARSCSSTGPATPCRYSTPRPARSLAPHIFVAALGASNYTYAEARWSETLPDWIGAHVNALAAIGGVPKAVVPDNLKAGITKPSRYEPGINRTYQDLADHYGCVVLPARVRGSRATRPRSKSRCRSSSASCWRRLRNRRFFSLAELNAAIRDCVDDSTPRSCASSATSRQRAVRRRSTGRRSMRCRATPYQLCRMEAGPRRARLPRRGRRTTTTRCRRG